MTAPANQERVPATAALLFWLALLSGLVGVTSAWAGADRGGEVAGLWAGGLAGAALGQLLGWLRLREGVALVLVVVPAVWAAPMLLGLGAASLDLAPVGAAFVPALVCGYYSLSERGGLAAFWFPAVLWMILIPDGPAGAPLDHPLAAPSALALGALFVAFFRARETRRVALWQAHGRERLAKPVARRVLRASPVRAAGEAGWAAAVGAGSLALAAWLAPHLWQRDVAERARAAPPAGPSELALSERPCCDLEAFADSRSRVREYFRLSGEREDEERRLRHFRTCVYCGNGGAVASTAGAGDGPAGDGPGAPLASAPGAGPGPTGNIINPTAPPGGRSFDDVTAPPGGRSFDDVTAPPGGRASDVATTPPAGRPSDAAAKPRAPGRARQPVAKGGTSPGRPVTSSRPSTPPAPAPADRQPPPPAAPPPAAPPLVASAPAAARPSEPAPAPPVGHPAPPTDPREAPAGAAAADVPSAVPWSGALALGACLLALQGLLRAARRALTLRHLARPFWSETLDQRVSNHWQRALIGLRDAGVCAAEGEQPTAFARRCGFEEMGACAEILERVRHGVRLEDADLDVMGAAAARVFAAARAKAGPAARFVAWFRRPLA